MPRRPPFRSADPQQTYSRILDGVFSFPAFLGQAACSLIAKLCRCPGAGGGALGVAGSTGVPQAAWRYPGRHLGASLHVGGGNPRGPSLHPGEEGVCWVRYHTAACRGSLGASLHPPHARGCSPHPTTAGAGQGSAWGTRPAASTASRSTGEAGVWGWGPRAPPPTNSCSIPPAPTPRWFGALKWKKLSLGQLEAPTLHLIKEVSGGLGGYWVLLGGRGGPALTSSHFPPTRDPPMSTSSVIRSTGRQQRMSSQAGTRISDSCGTPLDLPPPPWARVMGWGAAPAWWGGAINRGAAAGRRKEPEPWVQNPVPRLYSVGEGQLGGRGRWCGAAGVGCVVVGE